jgi:transposase
MAVKTDRKDAQGIAELMRVGWFRPVHCKSMNAQETRTMLNARNQVKSKLKDIEASLRGMLRNFGLKVGPITRTRFSERIKELVAGHPTLEIVAESMLAVHAVLLREFKNFEKRVRILARHDERARLLMTTSGVGPIVSLTYASAIDDPARFKKSKTVGAHFGITPKKYQSGETDYNGRISKMGDKDVRLALYQAAHIILTKPVKSSALKSWALRLAKRVGMNKAKVALARKLAVIMHRMLVDGTPFNPAKGAAAA